MNDLIEDREALRTKDLMELAYMLMGICERLKEELPIDDEAYLFKARMIAGALAEEGLETVGALLGPGWNCCTHELKCKETDY